jgi:hypothetical protein
MFFGGAAWTAEKGMYQDTRVEYSADEYMHTKQGTMKAKVYRAFNKERREQEIEGMEQITITRMDKKVMWILMTAEKMYMEMSLKESKGKETDLRDYKVEHSVIGEEVVNGVNTTKSKVILTGPKGNKFDGLMWDTRDGIMVKMDAVSTEKGSKEKIKIELKNLKMEKQDTKLFEVPAGYKKMSMPSMPGMGGDFDMKEMMKGVQ